MLIIGLPGKTLTEEDRRWLATPQVSGVILKRMFEEGSEVREKSTSAMSEPCA